MRTQRSLVLRGVALLSLGLLAGCAVSAPVARPADFPFHAVEPQFDIHWRLSPGPDVARAEGVVERRSRHIASVWLQLVGLDATGHIMSFTTPIWVAWGSWSDSESFAIALRPRGGEERFAVRVYAFEHEEGARTNR